MINSPEPWKKGEEHESSADLLDAEGYLVGEIRQGYGIRLPGDTPGSANIERILACVNACAGIPTESLVRVAQGVARIACDADGEHVIVAYPDFFSPELTHDS